MRDDADLLDQAVEDVMKVREAAAAVEAEPE